jgi:hypothetical protein
MQLTYTRITKYIYFLLLFFALFENNVVSNSDLNYVQLTYIEFCFLGSSFHNSNHECTLSYLI